MATIHLHQKTSLTPEQYVAGLTDFGPGRSKIFGNSADGYLKVHSRGAKEADVIEGVNPDLLASDFASERSEGTVLVPGLRKA